jgi:parvulin-like peptidyl-prolyl isomerase
LQQILTVDRESAQRALAAVTAGEAFADVARRWSRDPSASRGGDQGELSRDDLPPALADVIFRLDPGQLSPIVPAEYGFHIFLVSERHPAEQAPLGEVSEEIRGALRGAREDEHHAALVAEARSRYNPVIYGRNLPFTYQGQYPVVASRTRGGV